MYTAMRRIRPSTSESQTGNCGRPSVIPVGDGGSPDRKCADLIYVWNRTACRKKPKSVRAGGVLTCAGLILAVVEAC